MKWPYILAIALYCGVIFYLSSQSDLPTPPVPWFDWPGADKLEHLLVFGGLAAVFAFGLHRSNDVLRPAFALGLPIAFTTLYGLTDEIHQLFVPHRTFDLFDLLADAIGATIATGAVSLLAARFGGLRPSQRQPGTR